MQSRRFLQPSAQYSSGFHLSRPVKCPGCGLLIHKDRAVLDNGGYCPSCRRSLGVLDGGFGGALLR
jgi:predicted amidophosphoribosyltransferase